MKFGLIEALGAIQFWKDANKITIQPPGAIAADYALTLPTDLPTETKALTVANDGVMAFATVGTQVYRSTFVGTDLIDGAITITHGLNKASVLVQVFSDTSFQVIPDYIQISDNNNVWISVESFSVAANPWKVLVLG